MSNSNTNLQTQSSNALHNAIMEAGSKDRPPMLAPGNYVQWKSRIKRYIDTKPNSELIHYCLQNPPYTYQWAEKTVPVAKGKYLKTNYRKKAIERLKQGESINVQDLETNLYWEFGKFTSRDGESLESEQEIDKRHGLISLYRFKKIYKPTNIKQPSNFIKLTVGLIKNSSKESPRINRGTGYDNQRVVNVAGARENVAYHKEKMLLCKQEEAGVQLNAEQADWKDDTDDESEEQELEAHYMYMAQIQEVTPDQDNSGPIFDDEPMHKVQNNNDNYNVFAMENEHPEQPKSSNDIYLTEQGDTNITIDSLDICYDRAQDDQDETDDLDQERDLLASLIQKLKCEIDDSKNRNKFLESSNKELVDKLKGEIEDFKTKNKSLESSNNHFKEANNELSKTNQLMFKDLKKFQAELDKYNDVNYASKVEIDCAKAKGDLMSYKIEFEKSSNAYTRKINDLNQTISDMKKELCAHQETISVMSQAREAQIKLYKTRKDKELDKVIALENKFKVLNDIVYKTGQSIQTMNMLNRNCKTCFAKPEFLKKAQRANHCLYDIGCYNDNLALMLAPESDKMIRLDKESRSKLSDLIRPFDYDKLNNLYDLFVPQREKSPGQHYFPRTSKMSHTSSNNEFSKESFRKQTTLLEKRMDESIPWDQKCKSSKELFKIKKSVDTIFDGVERCKQTIAKRTYFGNIDPFIQNTIEGNFCPQIRRINADLENFHLCLNEEMVADLRYFNSLEHEVDTLKSQLETQKTQFLNEIDRLSREYYYADHMNAILGVYTDLDEVTNLQCDYLETLEKCEHLEKELSKSRTMSKSFEALQKHAINLELDLQHSETTTERYMENYKNVSQDIRDQLNAEAEAVQIILTGIDNDIYSTVDACPNACEMWKAIERLKQGESINVQDLETNLYWEFGKFTSRDGESLESYYSRFYKMMNELVRNQCHVTNHQVNVQFLLQLQPEWQRFVTLVKQSQELKTVSYHKLYDILKQHQNEVNEIRTERLARTANPLALVAQQQPVYHHQNHPTQNTQYSSTRSQQSTRNRGKAIVTSSAPTYDPEPATVTEDEEMSKEKEIDKLMALISLSFKKIYKPTNNNLRTSSNTSRANQDNSPRINTGCVLKTIIAF
ncbi:hypothetical protein Tco_0151286 [Tanacetum coccineum]